MKLQYYFMGFFVLMLVVVSWYASAQYQKAQFAKIPPVIIEVPVEVSVPGESIPSDQEQIAKLEKIIAEMTTAKEKEELQKKKPKEETEMVFSWDDYIDFISEYEPDIGEVVNVVYREKDIVDSCTYSYRDAKNSYSVDIKVRYDSKLKSFFFLPQIADFIQEKPTVWKRTNISVVYLSNKSGGMLIQYDVFRFFNVGAFAGFVSGEALPGVCIGYRF